MKTFSVETTSKIQYIEQINDEFILCKCYVMAAGKNRNFSSIGEEVVERNLGTLDYCPVVGYLYKNKDGEYRIAGHECELDDDWEIIPTTQAFGVVKPNSYAWETVNEYGIDVRYLTADVILWVGRFKGLFDARYNDEIYYSQSMEINVQEFRNLEDDSNYVEILDFSFSALCLLGKYDNPDENVTPCFISAKVVPKFSISDFASQIEEIKNKLFNLETDTKEGETMEDNKELTTTETEFESEAEVETAVETETEEVAETTTETETEETAEVEAETETVDYEAMYNEAQDTIATLTAKVTELTETVDSLMPYKLASEKAERDKAESDIFAKYDSHIGSMDEYVALKSKASEYSIEELDKECLILVGKFTMSAPAETETEETESTIQFALDNENENKPKSKYSEAYEAYKSR